MLQVTFPEHNDIIHKPKDMTDEQCLDLAVWKGQIIIDEEGNTCHGYISCWQLSKEDLEEIQRTGVIWQTILSNRLPPSSVQVEKPIFPIVNK